MKIAMKAEHTAGAGSLAHEPRGYDGNWPYDDGDVLVIEGTREELLTDAERYDRRGTSFGWAVAATIREMLS